MSPAVFGDLGPLPPMPEMPGGKTATAGSATPNAAVPPAPAARRGRRSIPIGAALGLPLLVGVLLGGRHASWAPGASIHELLPDAGSGGGLPAWTDGLREMVPGAGHHTPLPVWAEELHHLLPAQPDPLITPLATQGVPFAILIAVSALCLVFTAFYLLLVAKLSGVGDGARTGTAMACALYLKVLVLGIVWGRHWLTGLAPDGLLAAVGGPGVALIGCGGLASVIVIANCFDTGLGRAGLTLLSALLAPLFLSVAFGISLPFVFAPLLPPVV